MSFLSLRSSMRPARCAAFSLALLLLLGVRCDRQSREAPQGVILICIDTLRADRLGCYGHDRLPASPHLDELAQRSILFEDVTAPAGWTKPSVPSFLTGLYPVQHGVYEGNTRGSEGSVSDILPADAHTMAEIFREAGWRTAAFVHNAHLRAGQGIEQGFEVYLEPAGDSRSIRWHALDWLDELESGERFFLYLHILDVHMPYPIPDEYAGRFVELERTEPFRDRTWRDLRDSVNDRRRTLTSEERAALDALYCGAVRYVDDQIGRLFQALRKRGIEEETLICVVADHGEELGERGKLGHGLGLSEILLRVPWILHIPGRGAERIAGPVNLVDLFPTLISAAGLKAPDGVAGVDRLLHPEEDRPLFAEHKAHDLYMHSLRSGRAKLVRRFLPPEGDAKPPLPVIPGDRWEAELARKEGGELVATQVKPRDEPPEDPTELKGYLEEGGDGGWQIGGIPVRIPDNVRLNIAEGAKHTEPHAGEPVNLRGAFEGELFVAERVKIYAAGTTLDFEVRGAVEHVEGDWEGGRLRIAGLDIQFDAECNWKIEKRRMRQYMERLAVRLAAAVGGKGAEGKGFKVKRKLYDLDKDPLELAPAIVATDGTPLDLALDRVAYQLLKSAIEGRGGSAPIDQETIERLKTLGYGR
ncbi:MAG: sulfatase [Planctomycetota bacterium]